MSRKKHAFILRVVRKVHRTTGIFLFAFFIAVGLSGMMLGWKKNVKAFQAPTQKGRSSDLSTWLPMDTLVTIADRTLYEDFGPLSTAIDKIDARPGKGIVKVIYADHYHSFQLDATTGEVLSREHRTSDLIEHIHDGTIVDQALGFSGGVFKLIYTSVLGLALLTFSITGFWLWYGPKAMRHEAQKEQVLG